MFTTLSQLATMAGKLITDRENAVFALRTAAGMRLLTYATKVAPISLRGVAAAGDVQCANPEHDHSGHNPGTPLAMIAVVALEPPPGALLAAGFGRRMEEHIRDMNDLASLFSEPDARDPFDPAYTDGTD